jgi:HEAT repeat protein
VSLSATTAAREVNSSLGKLLRFVVQHLPADAVFALIRGVAKGQVGSGGLAQKLDDLVRGIHDPYLLCYLLLYVERNRLRVLTPQGGDRLQAVETLLINRLLSLRYQGAALPPPVLTPQLNRDEAQRQQQLWAELVRQQLLEEQEQRRRMLAQESPEGLRGRLADDHPDVRTAAAQLIGQKRFHLEADLIERLDDRDPDTRQAARRALARLARGTDFGPAPAATRAERRRAMQRWRGWLVLQGVPGGNEAAEGVGAGFKPAPTAPRSVAMKLVLEADGPTTLRTEDARVADLSGELIVAKGRRQEEVLARLRDARGVMHTEALALAIPRLNEEVRSKARDALAERLTRMTARTLRDKFADEDAEVRAAAARACARKGAREQVPDLLRLLEDPEVAVIQAARSALKELTGEDFGPARDANRSERLLSEAAWYGWWHKQQAIGK